MANVIGIKLIGANQVLYLPDFVKACDDFMKLILEIDVTISPTYEHSADWRLKALSYASPALLEVEGETREEQPDNRANVVVTALRGIESLKRSSVRPHGFSDRALGIAKDLATLLQNGVKSVELLCDGAGVQYDVHVVDNIEKILAPGKQMYGTLEGRIERMNSHEEFNFHLYEPILGRRIKCELMAPKDTELRRKVISLYEQAVITYGLLYTNINGEVTSAKITDINAKETAPLLKSASEVTGIWDLTGGDSPVELIRRMRDDG